MSTEKWQSYLFLMIAFAVFPLSLFYSPTKFKERPIESKEHKTSKDSLITIWYGPYQYFGHPGQAQRWINVLGNVQNKDQLTSLTYALNGEAEKKLNLGSDLHRLALPGDFNVELGWDEVHAGENQLQLFAKYKNGKVQMASVVLNVQKGKTWPLPYAIDFSKVKNLQKEVQIVDGHWKLKQDGVRTVQRYYDRVLSMGDTTWRNYEATVQFTIHDFTPPTKGPPTYNVTHFGVAMRWRGHHSDDRQPSRKWYPLGAQGELFIRENLKDCRWRILFDGGSANKKPVLNELRKTIPLGEKIHVKAQVKTLENGYTRYRYKQWSSITLEPKDWDIEGLEDTSDYPSGALCLVPHNTDVTIHNVQILPIP